MSHDDMKEAFRMLFVTLAAVAAIPTVMAYGIFIVRMAQ